MIPKIHGYYQWSNACGYGIHLSDDGEQAKLVINVEDPIVTDWLDIEWHLGNEGVYEPIIDPYGYNVPLGLVMKA